MRKPVCTVGFIGAVTLALAGCGASGIGVAPAPSPTPAPANLAGTWDGTWASSRAGRGTFVMTLSQSGSALSGTVSVTPAQPCFARRGFDGFVTGNDFVFSAEDADVGVFIVFRGTVNQPGTSGSGTYSFSFPCNEDIGTFSMTRR